jgi:hypothetical protein
MPWSFIIPAAASLIGGKMQGDAARSAADTAGAASDRAVALQREQYEKQLAMQKPFYDVGVNALPELVAASKYTNFGPQQFQQDPGYAFRLKEGQQALDRSAAARGGMISGGALKAAQRYGQEMGSQEYMNAFNRYQTERAARLQPLQSLTGYGQTTANTLGTAGSNMAGNIGNAYMQQGVNQGNALLAGSQARASSYGDIAKLYGQTNPNFGGLFGGGGSAPSGAAGYGISPSQYSGYYGQQ